MRRLFHLIYYILHSKTKFPYFSSLLDYKLYVKLTLLVKCKFLTIYIYNTHTDIMPYLNTMLSFSEAKSVQWYNRIKASKADLYTKTLRI